MFKSVRTATFQIALAAACASALVYAQTQAPVVNPCAPAGAKPAGPAAPTPAPTTPPPATPPPAGRGAAAAKPEPPAPARVLEGTDEDDKLTGSSGDDWLLGKNGADVLYGCGGKDKIDGGEGEDRISGGADADVIDAGPGRDILAGDEGNDTLDGHDDEDFIEGGAGDDDIDGGDGNDSLNGGPGNDVIAGGDENDRINGDAGNDRISGEDGVDTLDGGAGDDVVLGGEGNDQLAGGAGDDRLDGTDGNDFLSGGQNNDTLLGSSGNDTLQGDDGHDQLFGGDGNDALEGGPGSDWLMGGAGADTMFGGTGNDIFVIRAGDIAARAFELIDGGDGADILFLSGFSRPAVVAGDMRVIDPVTGGVYIIVNVERIEYTMILGQALQSAGQSVSVLLVNPSATATTGRVTFSNAAGAVVRAVVTGQQPTDDVKFSLAAFGSARLTATLSEAATAQVFASAPISATLVGGPAGTLAHGQSPLADNVIVPVFERATGGTGVLITNSSTTSSIALKLRNLEGAEMDDQFTNMNQVTIPAYGFKIFYVRDMFPSIKDFTGVLSIEGGFNNDWPQEGGSIAVTMLDRVTGGVVTGLPGVPLPPASPGSPVHFSRVGMGAGSTSTIVLMNTLTNSRAAGTLRLYDDGGAPLAALGDRAAVAASVPFDIPAAGSVLVAVTPPAGSTVGSARADVSTGRIAGLLRVTTGAQLTHLAASDFAEGFIAAVRRDRAANANTSVAISAGAAGASLRLKLRTAAGADVAGGEVELKLPANGQVTRTLEQLFPSAATEAFDGTLTVRAEGGNIAASVLQIGAAGSVPMALPVIRVQ